MKLSKEERLEKAKRDYPVGTIIKCAWGFNLPETDLFRDDRNDTVTGLPYFSESEDSILVPCHPNRKVFLYDCDFNKWAEIITSEPEKESIFDYYQPYLHRTIESANVHIGTLLKAISRLEAELKEAKESNLKALKSSISAIYFNDSSDYLSHHYRVVHYLKNIPLENNIEEREIIKWYNQLNE